MLLYRTRGLGVHFRFLSLFKEHFKASLIIAEFELQSREQWVRAFPLRDEAELDSHIDPLL